MQMISPDTGSPGSSLGMGVLVLLTLSLAVGMALRYVRWVVDLLTSDSKRVSPP
ncbi:hypothetical protein [Hahella sp. CCB-MM4]|uniref:hypothetical protein n=1 Tax=Hahella sp. (strain CCB-MM4) TaxID=1926491 RepID=UPI00143D5876|nr:hypothetical protein [Hahella sp. CCB-MM4]